MAKGFDDIVIEWAGLDELVEELGEIEKHHEKIIARELTEFGNLAEEGSRALAPHEYGDLSTSISFGKALHEGNGVFVVTGGSNSPYALRRHEEPYRIGKHAHRWRGKDYYEDGRGLGTRKKPKWRGYDPGRKYMENAIRAIEGDYNAMNQRVLDKIMGL